MKRKLTVALLSAIVVLCGFVTSCYDDSALNERIDGLESRVDKLEQLCREMNTNIGSLQTLLQAIQDKDYVTSVTPIEQNGAIIGYTINFTKSKPITIYHGKDGYTLQIGVRQDTDGVWYWTLNGEWLLDDDGNKIKPDGKDGITPELKIEEGSWYISFDNGSSWTQLGKATGEDGDSMFSSVTYNENYVYFTLADGTVLTLPRSGKFDVVFNETQGIGCMAGQSTRVSYTLTGDTRNVQIECIGNNGWDASDERTSETGGNIIVTAPNPIKDGKVIVYATNEAGQASVKALTFTEGVMTALTDASVAPFEGGNITLTITTNMDYTLDLPEWIHRVETKAVHTDILNLVADENPSWELRTGTITITYGNGQVSTVDVYQKGLEVPNNEIWYKTLDNKPIDIYHCKKEYGNDPFDVRVVSHHLENGRYVIRFENDVHTICRSAFGFQDCNRIIEILLPNSIEHLEESALNCLFGINTLRIPDNLKIVDLYAFPGDRKNLSRFIGKNTSSDGKCVMIDGVLVYFAGKDMQEYTIPQETRVIAPFSMSASWDLEKVIFNDGLKRIEHDAFMGCDKLSCITIPESVEIIEYYAFLFCPNITAFYGNTHFISEDHMCLYFYDLSGQKVLQYFAGHNLTEYVIPDGVVGIENYCFQFANNLEKLTFPNSLLWVGGVAFDGCNSLQELYGPNTTSDHRGYIIDGELQFIVDKGLHSYTTPQEVTIIGQCAFGNKTSLEEVILSDNVTNVSGMGYIFQGSCNLKRVTISASMKDLRYDPFMGSFNLETAYVRAPIPPNIIHNPIECMPNGKHDFDGSAIYIPQQSYELYKNHPGWAIYGDLLRPYDFGDLSEFMPDWYISSDYSKDGAVQKFQSATVGKGIDLVFMGDGFIDKDMAEGGKYEQTMTAAMEKFFSIEPYKTFRDRFNVYAVKVVSMNDQWGDNARHAISENNDIAFRYASAIEGINQEHLYVNVIYNSPTDGSWYGRSYTTLYHNDGSYVAYNMEGVNNVLIHEAAGHGFAKLADEYVEYNESFTDYHGLDQMHDMNWYQNVDYRNAPGTVYWSRFLSDSRYDGQVGIYEGAFTFAYGAYRPTENSMMRYNDSPFNAPSREAIYKAIMRESEGPGWVYNYEDFVAYDAINRQASTTPSMMRAKSRREISEYQKHHKAPVIVKGTWRDAMKDSK